MTYHPVLAFPDFEDQFDVKVDASSVALAKLLSQLRTMMESMPFRTQAMQ